LSEFGPGLSVDLAASPVVIVAHVRSVWISCEVSKPGKSCFNQSLVSLNMSVLDDTQISSSSKRVCAWKWAEM